MKPESKVAQARAAASERALSELQAIRRGQDQLLREVTALCRAFDEFAGVFLNARFRYGKPTDRWARPRG